MSEHSIAQLAATRPVGSDVIRLVRENQKQRAEIARLRANAELDNARGHREADNRESKAEIERLLTDWGWEREENVPLSR